MAYIGWGRRETAAPVTNDGEDEDDEGGERAAERVEGREGDLGPLDDYFRSGQPCQPLGLQTERF